MSESNRMLALRVALIATGAIFIFGIYPLSLIWPSGWTWGHGHSQRRRTLMRIAASSGSPYGRASSMRPSWPCSLSATGPNAVIWWAMCQPCSSLRLFSQY